MRAEVAGLDPYGFSATYQLHIAMAETGGRSAAYVLTPEVVVDGYPMASCSDTPFRLDPGARADFPTTGTCFASSGTMGWAPTGTFTVNITYRDEQGHEGRVSRSVQFQSSPYRSPKRTITNLDVSTVDVDVTPMPGFPGFSLLQVRLVLVETTGTSGATITGVRTYSGEEHTEGCPGTTYRVPAGRTWDIRSMAACGPDGSVGTRYSDVVAIYVDYVDDEGKPATLVIDRPVPAL